MKLMSRLALGCGFALYLLLFTCMGIYFYFSLFRGDQIATLVNFAGAMRDNDAFRAKWHAAPEQWDRIDAWMSKHKGFSCSLLGDLRGDGWSGVGHFEVDAPYKYSFFQSGSCEGHRVVLEDIFLERRGQDWIVVEIGTICATYYGIDQLCDPPK
jgi:hypothetical protein